MQSPESTVCKNCGNPIYSGYSHCPNCGPPKKRTPQIQVVLIVSALFCFAYLIFYCSQPYKTSSHQISPITTLSPPAQNEQDSSNTASQLKQEHTNPTKISKEEAEQGRKLYNKILDKYPNLDELSRKPFLLIDIGPGYVIKSAPLLEIMIPLNDWNSLSESDRNSLAKYVSSLVDDAKANPFAYSNIPASAPIAQRIRLNVFNMTSDSWVINEGQIFSLKDIGLTGIGMSSGKTLRYGKHLNQ